MVEPHPAGERWVAQEGAFSAATSDLPVLHYFPARGRAEPIRLTLALARQPWFETNPEAQLAGLVRRQLDGFAFRQLPRFVDEPAAKVDVVQSMAILRHLGRQLRLYGDDLPEAAAIDMVIDGVGDLRAKLKAVWLTARLAPEAVARYRAAVLAPEDALVQSDEPGPGLACLERLLSGGAPQATPGADEGSHVTGQQGSGGVAGGGSGDGGGGDDGDARQWLVGERLSIADVAVADLVDMHLSQPAFEGDVRRTFPHLMMHHKRVMGQPGIKEYLASCNRHSLVWGQEWIDQQQRNGDAGS